MKRKKKAIAVPPTITTRLIEPTAKDLSSLPDLLLALAENVEEAMQSAGAVPGEDYTYVDLFQLATPLAVTLFESGKVNVVINA